MISRFKAFAAKELHKHKMFTVCGLIFERILMRFPLERGAAAAAAAAAQTVLIKKGFP